MQLGKHRQTNWNDPAWRTKQSPSCQNLPGLMLLQISSTPLKTSGQQQPVPQLQVIFKVPGVPCSGCVNLSVITPSVFGCCWGIPEQSKLQWPRAQSCVLGQHLCQHRQVLYECKGVISFPKPLPWHTFPLSSKLCEPTDSWRELSVGCPCWAVVEEGFILLKLITRSLAVKKAVCRGSKYCS